MAMVTTKTGEWFLDVDAAMDNEVRVVVCDTNGNLHVQMYLPKKVAKALRTNLKVALEDLK